MKILIVGGGLGGLTLAAFLKDSDVEYDIAEKSLDWQKQGYAIGLWSNGRNILGKLGLADIFDATGTRIHTYSICDGAGRALRTYNLRTFYADYGTALTLVDRNALHSWLRSCVDLKKIMMGVSVDSITRIEGGATVHFSNGQTKNYDVVVGADGIHSQVRTLLFKDDVEIYDNWRVWYGWIDNSFKDTATITEYLEAGAGIIIFDTGEKTLVNFFSPVSHTLWDTPKGRIEKLKTLLKSEKVLVPGIFCSLEDGDVTPTDLARVSLTHWSKGPVVLVGDAAHACEPFAGLAYNSLAQQISRKLLFLIIISHILFSPNERVKDGGKYINICIHELQFELLLQKFWNCQAKASRFKTSYK